MTIRQLLSEKRTKIQQIAAKHSAFNVRLFGSVARGEDREDSDIDLLVSTREDSTPWFPAGLILDLEAILGRRVQIITDKGLNGFIRDTVLREAAPL